MRWGFKARELEVAFFALQGVSSREVGRRLNLSYRTVNNRLLQLYRKTGGVNNLNQFRTCWHQEGFDRYVPSRFLCMGSQVIEKCSA